MRNWFVTMALVTAATGVSADTSAWREFRGSAHDGTSEATGLPLTWSETENIKWKTALPGAGHSSPVAENGRVWLTHSPDEGKSRHVLCVDFETGKILRDIKLFTYNPEGEQNHKMNSYASQTPVVENNRVYVTFGNPGTACLNAETGEVIWERRDITNQFWDCGAACSPTLYGSKLIVNSDGEPAPVGRQFVIALDKDTGKTLWRTERKYSEKPERTHAFTVPIVVKVGDREQVVSSGANGVFGYDLETGEELWVARYKAWSVVPRPIAADNMAFVFMGVVHNLGLAIRLDKAKGDITGTDAIAWRTENKRIIPDMPSPLLVNNRLYTMTPTTLSCIEPATGNVIWSEKVPGQHLASPVSAEGRIYLFNTDGGAAVVALGDTFELLAGSKLDTGCYASPAIVGKSLVIRTSSHLYRIEK
ncbi:MAG: PQQ-binding-like beta-propeller repeat protein [Kiritimatiellaeota bacterium]|nr:PQQ-binding-like beta-propeller repeat protein [Kiritimatiellota bacterium]